MKWDSRKTGENSLYGANGMRVKLGLSQDDVVLNSSRITKGTVSDIENGKRNLSFTTLIDLAKGLKVHPKDLLDFKSDLDKE